ncbi:hypothetical protein [Pseudoalteromonas luteoviolacea]|uniref:FAD-binding oxidoreductase n=2 Tax=Pseudoalteromonas luteoviolacea TaxID=43657 RepID=A0A162BC82_9GAMM|nr:hypothetical protein [Pseudoalteromonas luteoviolacea]KZN70412.1 hypothetical protein N478_00480 [Pseudoalteromonas luteoviolacea S4060-1]OCQ23808.1 hypothetical protein A7985_07675 [Pseudoalteromonas luteoviolacea]
MRTLLSLLFILISTHLSANSISAFTSDGCSVFPDGTPTQKELWLSCCTAHDYAYWKGGTYDDRLNADRELEKCVANVGEAKIAKLMLAGVRVGGSPYLPTSFRWGYGWPYPRFYEPLSPTELAQIARLEKLAEGNPVLSK